MHPHPLIPLVLFPNLPFIPRLSRNLTDAVAVLPRNLLRQPRILCFLVHLHAAVAPRCVPHLLTLPRLRRDVADTALCDLGKSDQLGDL